MIWLAFQANQDETAREAARYAVDVRRKWAETHSGDDAALRALAEEYGTVGALKFSHGDIAGALEALHAALAVRRRQAATAPDSPERQGELGIALTAVGQCLGWRGDWGEARQYYGEAVAIAETWSARIPADLLWQIGLVNARVNLASVMARSGDMESAELQKALARETLADVKRLLAAGTNAPPGTEPLLAQLESTLQQ